MAGIAGIYCADGRPADTAELQRMAVALQHRAPDGTTYWSAGPVGFAHLQFCTTPESLHEHQPLVGPGAGTCLVWHGRLDNREELIEALSSRSIPLVDNTDPGLVLSAYLAWGKDSAARLVGDFAFAIWDAGRRELWCARDYQGVRPFYYFWDGKQFLFASEIRSLLTHPGVSLRMNEGMVGEYLLQSIVSREDTLYWDIHRLPPGSFLTISPSRDLRIEAYWVPDLRPLTYRSDDEYADHFLQVLEKSVSSRLRCTVPWAAELSGGLDSSSVAVTAQRLLNPASSGNRVSTFSLAEPGKPWDESEYINEISQFAGLRSECFPQFVVGLDHFQRSTAWSRELPDSPNGKSPFMAMYETIRRRGVKVLLTGAGGNQWLEGNLQHLVDLARSGDIRRLAKRAKADWRFYGGRAPWPIFLLRRLLPSCVPDSIRSRVRKRRLNRPGILSAEFMRRTCLSDRLASSFRPDPRAFSSGAQRILFLQNVSGSHVDAIEAMERESAALGLEERHPFYDRRLAEFCLRLPEDQRQRGITHKWILRNATRGSLPERVRLKEFQAEFSDLYHCVLSTPVVVDRLRNLTMSRNTDWLDHGYFSELLQSFLGRSVAERQRSQGAIWMVLALDLWFDDLTGVAHG
jgi:asparagine synthase (glutamine-hydrolysing)